MSLKLVDWEGERVPKIDEIWMLACIKKSLKNRWFRRPKFQKIVKITVPKTMCFSHAFFNQFWRGWGTVLGGFWSSNRYHYSTPNIFYLFFKPLLGELRKKIEVTSMESNLFFLISPSYCGTIHLLTGARCGRKNSTKYLINQSFRNNIQIRLIKQWLITPIFFFTAWHPLSSCFVPVTVHRNLCYIKVVASR